MRSSIRSRIGRSILALAVAFLATSAFAGHHLNGTWKLDVDLGGQTGTATFTLEEGKGGEITGTYTGVAGTQPVKGKVDGAKVMFGFDSPDVGKVSYEGTYSGGKLSGECTYSAMGKGTFEGGKVES